jgi:hypothetical protein
LRRGRSGEPGFGFLGDVRGVIVENQLYRRMGRIGGVEKLEEFDVLAGTLLAESQRGEEVARLIEPVRHVFAAIFLVAVGMLIDPHLLQGNWEALAVLSILACAVERRAVYNGRRRRHL